MGSPSDARRRKRRRRPGKRERARVKTHRRGGGTYTLKAGQKKLEEAHVSNNPANQVTRWLRGLYLRTMRAAKCGLHRYAAVGSCPIKTGNQISTRAVDGQRMVIVQSSGMPDSNS